MLFLAEEKLSNLCSLLGAYSQYVGGSRSLHAHKLNRFNHVQLFVTQWTIPYQAPLSMEFSRPEYWSRYSLLQGIFPTQGSNPGLPLCRQIPYHLSCQGSPRILEWVAYPFSSGSSRPRNPAPQADSLTAELPGKPFGCFSYHHFMSVELEV